MRKHAIATLFAALCLLLAASGIALAVEPDEMLEDPVLEARARAVSQQLRCLVCQNQSIDDSDAGLAKDLRLLVRERIAAGDRDEAVLAFAVSRYGDFVLLAPPVKPKTYALWFAPAVLLLLGGTVVAVVFSRRRRIAEPPPLTEEEHRRLDALLATAAPDDQEQRS